MEILSKRLKMGSSSPPGKAFPAPYQVAVEAKERDQNGEHYILNAEITELILDSLDMARQKICRLVSKSFNCEICRIFARKGVAIYLNSNYNIPPFKETYLRSLEVDNSLYYSPFSKATLCLHTSDENALDFYQFVAEYPDLRVGTISVYTSQRSGSPAPADYLEMIAPSLTVFETCYWAGFPDFPQMLHFPKLRKFVVTALKPGTNAAIIYDIAATGGILEREVKFMSGIIDRSPGLRHLKCKGLSLASKLLTSCDLKRLGTLSIHPERNGNKAFESSRLLSSLTRVKISHLTRLSLSLDFSESSFCHRTNEIIASFSTSLNSVRLWTNEEPWIGFPHCPHLTQLTFLTLDIQRFPWESVPKLGFIFIHARRMVGFSGLDGGSPALINQSLRVKQVWLDRRALSNIEQLQGLVEDPISLPSQLFQVFPNARHWKINIRLLPAFSDLVRASNAEVHRLAVISSFCGDPLPDEYDITPYLKPLTKLSELDCVLNIECPLSPLLIRFSELPSIRILRWQALRYRVDYRDFPISKTLIRHLASLERFELIEKVTPLWNADLEEFFTLLPGAVRTRKFLNAPLAWTFK